MQKLIRNIEKIIIYKVLKIGYKIYSIINYICNHNIKFKVFITIILK